ncbi:hypothetical protein FC98_GL001658 [Lentilactobacillus kisonensis DSM 19906 = JCM 15041]|uniref:Uncharacterized protein n=2 Tax=Lentilactobacillus kisonensis TaxID=481722 RepID=A0A0R1NT88_9LACO|nr:hypothetical protein FC98_GL001658 [Lentilactobacillus kisonensis DSM 19906 = JCM 15041]
MTYLIMSKRVDFSLSLLFFWVKGFVSVDSRFVKVTGANTILGFIPAGKDQQAIPLKNVSSTRISTQYKVLPIIIGAIFAFIGFGELGTSFIAGLIWFVLGIALIGSGILTVLDIQRAGNDFYVSVPFFDKAKLLDAQDMIETGLSGDTDKTDLNQFFDKKSDLKKRS